MSTTLTIATHESEARAFAAEFPTTQVRRAIALAEVGTLTWEQIAGLFRKSLASGIAACQPEQA
jgi:hypothetical protein